MRNTLVVAPIRKAAKLALIALAAMVLVPTVAIADNAAEIKAIIMQGNADSRKNLSADSEGLSEHGSLEFWSSGGLMQHVPADSPAATWEHFALTPKHTSRLLLWLKTRLRLRCFTRKGRSTKLARNRYHII